MTQSPDKSRCAAIYARVSRDDQTISIGDQVQRLTAYAVLAGLHVVEVIEENGVSGSVPLEKRPGGQRLLGLLGRKAMHCLTLRLDRLSRSSVNALSHIEDWNKRGIALHLADCGGSALDVSSAVGTLFITILSGMAQYERQLISERTSSALQHKKSKGECYGRLPFGKDKTGDGRLVENAEEQAVIEEIKRMRQARMSYGRIAKALNDRGIQSKRGRQWYAASVSYLLKRLAA